MKFLIVGQTPPPYGGQSINIARMIDTLKKNSINYKFIRMNFSEEMSENGSVSFKKIIKLFQLFININYNIIFNRPDFLYYPPSGSERVPVIRDIVLLFFARLFKVKIIFHFHAGGIASLYPELKGTIRLMFEKAFFFPEYSICLSSLGKSDPIFLKSHNISVIPNGVENIYRDSLQRNLSDKFIVLFIGVCRETKGILDFLEVVKQCNSINPLIIGRIIGKTFSDIEEKAIEEAVKKVMLNITELRQGMIKMLLCLVQMYYYFLHFLNMRIFPLLYLRHFLVVFLLYQLIGEVFLIKLRMIIMGMSMKFMIMKV
nr:hypothetical protein [Siphonobacter sp. SORGH_AS_0500]